MNDWAPKVFWSEVGLTKTEDGFSVVLDERPVKTPAKQLLVMPTQAIADMVADEWRAQSETVDPETMPTTRLANSALDRVTPQFADIADMLGEYGATDLLCFRSDIAELSARQTTAWDPVLDWAADRLNVRLVITEGIMPVDQPKDSLRALRGRLDMFNPFELAALHDLITISGSLVLALALAENHVDVNVAWNSAHLDEAYQAEQWGHDAEAVKRARKRHADFAHAAAILRALRG